MATHPNLSPEYLVETNTSTLLAICIIFLTLNTLFTGLRFVARHYQKAPWGWDDFFMGLAWLTASGLCIDGIIAPRWGAGLHIERVMSTMPEQIPNFGRNAFYAVPIIYTFACTLPKISVLILYLRVFVDRFSRYCCWVLLGILIVSGVINIFTQGFQCNTQEASWDTTLPGRHCNDIQAHLTYASLPNIITDVAMLLLPIPVVRRLQVAAHVKIGLLATFVVASAGLITSVIRFAEFFVNPYASDPTWYAAPLIMWVVIETGIYVICACLLTFRPILAKTVYNKHVSMVYAWLRETTSFATPRSERSSQSGDSLKKERYGNDKAPILSMSQKSKDGSGVFAGHGTSDAFAGHGEDDDLESDIPEVPGQIHVRHDFRVGSQDIPV